MFTPFWCKHVDSEACSIEEEFENHGFSDPFTSLTMNPLLTIVHISNRSSRLYTDLSTKLTKTP
jgi:hypothetical protein